MLNLQCTPQFRLTFSVSIENDHWRILLFVFVHHFLGLLNLLLGYPEVSCILVDVLLYFVVSNHQAIVEILGLL